MEQTKLKPNHRIMLRRRGLDPKDYRLIKDTFTSLYVLNIKTRKG